MNLNLFLLPLLLLLVIYFIKNHYIEKYFDVPYQYGPYNHNYAKYHDIFMAHPVKQVKSKCYDKLTKHVKLNDSGGMMYISHKKPKCHNNVECPKYVIDGINVLNDAHNTNDMCIKNDTNVKCWK